MDPVQIAQLVILALQAASQLVDQLSSDDEAKLVAAMNSLNAQVDALHKATQEG